MVLTMTPATTCPRCHASEVRHVTGDQWLCCHCGRTLRLVIGSGGPTLVPLVRLPWERPMPKR
jgi:ribosomal protein L37AE/L43A